MNPRDIILAAVRKNLPEPKVPLPALSEANEEGSTTRTGYPARPQPGSRGQEHKVLINCILWNLDMEWITRRSEAEPEVSSHPVPPKELHPRKLPLELEIGY